MSKPAKRDEPERRPAKVEPTPVTQPQPAMQIVLRRLWQGCYALSGGLSVALIGAYFGENKPSWSFAGVIVALLAVLAGAGVLLEVAERRRYPGGKDDG